MDDRPQRRVENYTVPFLIVAGVFLFFALLVVWELWGYNRALALALALWVALRVTSA
ncbi:hypothetical protein [Rhodovulum adriaticum]|uniref:Uncharacterized protein n=1 Tax=Rhodovulum adriaticum TaxID=35804 RepID=A0A4R2NID7_RHOAD|nr:hypothetical protein [Rhodovulum adriaticum]TCP21269.1 hypothetical protein EV656_11285 [Rhodovulum adriaticum]